MPEKADTMQSPSRRFSLMLMPCVMVLLAIIGVSAIYSAGYVSGDFPVRTHWKAQIFWLALGMVVYAGVSRWNFRSRSWSLFVLCGYGASMILLAAVLAAGVSIGGARRWLQLGPILIQPAEFAKVFSILCFCLALSGKTSARAWRQWAVACGAMALCWILILVEPSFGNAFLLIPCALAVICAKCVAVRWWTPLLATTFMVLLCFFGGLLWMRSCPTETRNAVLEKIAGHSGGFLHEYHLRRINGYLSPQGDWNERQSLLAVAGGGATGKGYLNGTLKRLGFLPRTVAPTDFIFAVIAEEGGFFFGTLPILLLYLAMTGICLHWAGHAADDMGQFTAIATATLLFEHILISIGMSVRLLPIIGLPLPLLSYGGSFTVATCLLLGAAASAAHSTNHHESTAREEHTAHAWHFSLSHLLHVSVRDMSQPTETSTSRTRNEP